MKSKPILNIFIFFSVIIILVLGIYHFLQRGIAISQLEFGNVVIDEFYLILDKKLNLNVQAITIKPSSNAQEASSDVALEDNIRLIFRIVKNIKTLRNLIGVVQIDEIIVNQFRGSALMNSDIIQILFPHWRLQINLYDDNDINALQIHIAELNYLPYDISLSGLVSYDIDKQQITCDAILDMQNNITIYSEFMSDFKSFSLKASSETFSSLNSFVPLIDDPQAALWLKRMNGFFHLNKLNLEGNFQNNFMNTLKENLFIELQIQQGKLVYDDSLSPVEFEQANLIYHKNFIQTYFIDLRYEKIPLEGSTITLIDVFDNPELVIQILANARLDSRIQKILKAYNISLPLAQKTGSINTDLTLNIPFDNRTIGIDGYFSSPNTLLSISGFDIHAQNVEVWLKNGVIVFENIPIQTHDTPQINANLTLMIDTNAKIIQGNAAVHSLNIQKDIGLFALYDSDIPIQGNFAGSNMQIALPSLGININVANGFSLEIPSLNELKQYSKIIQDYGIKGSLNLSSHDASGIKIQAVFDEHQLPITTLDDKPIKPLHITGAIQQGNVSLNTQNNFVTFQTTKDSTNVTAQNVNIIIPTENFNASPSPSDTQGSILNAQGKNVNLDIKGRKIFGESIIINKDRNGNITGTLKDKNTAFNVQYDGRLFSIHGTRIRAEILNKILGTNAFEGGVYTLLGEYQQNIFKANLSILKGTIKNLLNLQNWLATFDSIQSLLIFKAPGFDANGYKVENGSIDIEINPNSLFVHKIELNGNTIDIKGKGAIDLVNNNTIDFNLKLTTFKATGAILSNIPIVNIANYLIVGDDGSYSTSVHVTGTVQKPEYGVSLLKNTFIEKPTDIIERTLKAPANILE